MKRAQRAKTKKGKSVRELRGNPFRNKGKVRTEEGGGGALKIEGANYMTRLGRRVAEPNEIGNLIEEVVDLTRHTDLEGDNDDVQELQDSHYQTWAVCVERESLYKRRVGGYPLHVRPSPRKWACCCSVVWEKISNEAVTESSNTHWGASDPGGIWIFQSHD
ncbi:hypothetical protein TNCV_93491 [Trichonephila clavipes]|nr:hypothetical protein TNCV_93491 [Trichonephila clavipes]